VKEITTVLLEINNNNSVHFIICSLRCRLIAPMPVTSATQIQREEKKSIKRNM